MPPDTAAPANPTPEAIRAARKAAGLTQTQAAALIYCTLRGWQDWEAGKRAMHPAFFELFRRKLVEFQCLGNSGGHCAKAQCDTEQEMSERTAQATVKSTT